MFLYLVPAEIYACCVYAYADQIVKVTDITVDLLIHFYTTRF